MTVVSSRYGFVGGMARQAIYRFEGIFLNAFVWFSSVYAVYRFFHVVIWKRVMEINEGLVMRYRIFFSFGLQIQADKLLKLQDSHAKK